MSSTELMVEASPQGPWQLKKLTELHKQAAALLAQGVGRQTVATACDFTPEYITMLQQQPLFIGYVKEMTAAAATRLEALFDESVEVIADTMKNGTEDGKLKAVKLQLEATGRVGQNAERERTPGDSDRLSVLAERLVSLLATQRRRVFENET